MNGPYPTSEEYDERAHRLYNDGDFDGALETLKEGIALYPHSVDLYVGLGYARMAREEFAWAKNAFEQALVLDPAHEDGLVGLGETLLRFGRIERALELFGQVRELGYGDDPELMMTIGRALYREGLFAEAREVFLRITSTIRPDSADAVAALGYTLQQLGDGGEGVRHLRRALRMDPDLHEARVHLGHILYERGDWESALRELERVPPADHWDPLGVWRLLELKRSFARLPVDDPSLRVWQRRLAELDTFEDPIDRLLAEIEAAWGDDGEVGNPGQLELFTDERAGATLHRIRSADGRVFVGGWAEIVRQMRDHSGFGHEGLSDWMRRMAERWHEQYGFSIPFSDPHRFLMAASRAGLITIEE